MDGDDDGRKDDGDINVDEGGGDNNVGGEDSKGGDDVGAGEIGDDEGAGARQ